MLAYLPLIAAAFVGIGLIRRFLGSRLELPEQVLGGVAFGWILASSGCLLGRSPAKEAGLWFHGQSDCAALLRGGRPLGNELPIP